MERTVLMVYPGFALGEWKVVEQRGSGGTAFVYKAEAAQGQVGAAKVLRPELQGDAERVARFRSEAERRQREEKDVYLIEDLYYVMRFYEGYTFRLKLTEEREKHDGYRGAECYDVFYQLANLLVKRHLKGSIHGDLKPDNIQLEFRNAGYDARLLDSGGGATALYQAPEYYEKNTPFRVTTAADIYSFGIMLWEAVTGEPPFVADSSDEIRLRHLGRQFDTARLYKCRCPASLEDLIFKCLSRDPNDRPAARELAAKLKPLTVPELLLDRADEPSERSTAAIASPTNKLAHWRWPIAAAVAVLAATSIALPSVRHGGGEAGALQPKSKAATGTSAVATANQSPAQLGAAASLHAPLSAEEIKAVCAPFDGTDYACVPTAMFLMGLTREQIIALCDHLGSDCTRTPHGVLETLLRALPEGRIPFEVHLSTFAMTRTPVTCAQYAAFLNVLRTEKDFGFDMESRAKAGVKRMRYPTWKGKRIYDLFAEPVCIEMAPKTEVFSAKRGLGQRPVELVSWYGAEEFCARQQAELPTEAQFAYVRGYAHGDYPWGTSVEGTCKEVAHGQFPQEGVTPVQHGECESVDDKGPRDVGTSPLDVVPGLGIKDLGGGVRQWTNDGFVEHLKACDGPCVDPVTPPQASGLFAQSGGSYDLPRWFGMSATRGQDKGAATMFGAGLRCVKNTTTKIATRGTP